MAKAVQDGRRPVDICPIIACLERFMACSSGVSSGTLAARRLVASQRAHAFKHIYLFIHSDFQAAFQAIFVWSKKAA